jgi:4-amino-4-deoxy-L-arabinose transferase-like glycosyltransferase
MAYRPGHYFTYPPLHLVILTILTLPATLLALVRSASLSPPDVIAEITRVPYMTIFAVAARLVTDVMAAGIVYAVASIAEELWGRRAGLWAAAVAALNTVFVYYAHTSNLDVPYLFWTLLSYLWLVRAIVRHEPTRLRGCALFAVLAIATKDQAYASFVVALPLAVGLWVALDTRPRECVSVVREAAASALGAALLLALIDGALVNPTGFVARLRFLAGPASEDHAYYAKSLAGRARVVFDAARSFGRYYPVGLVPFVLYGLGLHVTKIRGDPALRVAGLAPALGVLSFTFAFNCVARRTEPRFLLPQSIFVSLYAGAALDSLTRPASRVKVAAWILAALIGSRALFDCVAVDVALLRDPRYEAEAWLNENVLPGELIEVYGNNAHLPRLPTRARVERVDPSPLSDRSPIPGMQEIEAPYADIDQRRPDWIVMSEGWSWRYQMDLRPPPGSSLVLSRVQRAMKEDLGGRAFFASLFAGTADYTAAHVARYDDSLWPRVDIHSSTARTIYVFRRAGR